MKRQKNKIQQIDFTDKTKSFHAFPPHFQRRSHGKHKKLTFPSIRYELPGFITILAKSKHILMKALLFYSFSSSPDAEKRQAYFRYYNL